MAGNTAVEKVMNCPKCGREIGEGKAYCSDPACGAVIGPQPPEVTRSIKYHKEIKLNFKLSAQTLARAAAIAITAAAAAYLFFSPLH